jgi:seryl-tRNA synthetase
MIDMDLIRKQPDKVRAEMLRRRDSTAAGRIDAILNLDQKRRAILAQSESLQAERNKLNSAMGKLRGNKALSPAAQAAAAQAATQAIQAGNYATALAALTTPPTGEADPSVMNDLMAALKTMGERVESLTKDVGMVDLELRENALWLPNILDENVPDGDDGNQNILYAHEGDLPAFDFTPKPHWEIGPALGIIDFERGTKLSGTRFYVLRDLGARLQRAMINFFLDFHTTHGYTELYLPYIVREEMFYGAGQFPKFKNDIYTDPDAALYLLPTAEVGITGLHRDEILEEAQLPLNYVANTPCWRREATSAGRDVRGIKRVHQFQKVEMYRLVKPEDSAAALEQIIGSASEICRALKIPFRKVELVSGDVGFGMKRTFDLEMWAPGCQEWLEVSSCSNAGDFQARRSAIKYRPAGGGKAEFIHTLNGSGLAVPRVIIAILENFQQVDGSVLIPEVLRPYMGMDIISAR